MLYVSETAKDMAIVATECKEETICKLLNGTIFSDLANLYIMVMPLFDTDYLINSMRYRHRYNEILIVLNVLLKCAIANDLEYS